MKPQPMSDAEILRLFNKYNEKLAGGGELFHFDEYARAIIAARDAQWAAMIGGPVAWLHPEEQDVEITHKLWMSAAWVPLYAIKETP